MQQHGFGKVLQNVWDWRAAGNFMFGGTGSGLLFLVAVFSFPESPPLLIGLIALCFVAAGLTLVWLEIGRPWRFINVYFNPWTSWMSREAFVAALVFAMAFIGILLQLPLVILLAGIASLFFLYCQARILKASKGIPAWREPAIMQLVQVTGLAEGAGLLLLMNGALGIFNPILLTLFAGLLLWRIWAWSHYRKQLNANRAPEAALAELAKINSVTLVVGNLIPLLLLGITLVATDLISIVGVLAGGLAVLSGWYMKFTIVTRAAHYQGFALPRTRVATAGKRAAPV